MALTTTTLNGAITADQVLIKVTSGTSFGKGKIIRIDDEFLLQTADADAASTTLIPVRRGQNGTQAKAHPTLTNVVMGSASQLTGSADFGGDQVTTFDSYPLSGRNRRILSYQASGAITLPSPGNDMVAVLIGTSALTMTVAAPTTDMDGCRLMIVGNAKSASTVQFAGTVGLGNAGASYDIITFQNAGNVGIEVVAVNGFWTILSAPAITGTTTAIGVAVA